MHQFLLSRVALIFLSTTLATLAVGCREDKQPTAFIEKKQHALLDKTDAANPATTTVPIASPIPSTRAQSRLESDSFEQGLDKATSAFSISQSARSIEDWSLVASQFQEAIALLKRVPVDSPYFSSAQTKITEFQRQLKYAQRQATHSRNTKRVVIAVPRVSSAPNITLPQQTAECSNIRFDHFSRCPSRTVCSAVSARIRKCSPLSGQEKQPSSMTFSPPERLNQQQVFIVPIKRRVGGTPIIEVTFNGDQQFEMILDTGASGTVINQKMADALGVIPVGKAKANTASSKAVEFPIGYIDSIEVGGARVNQIAVAIAGSDLETGLLGHDFFGNYDLTIKRDVIEFRPQAKAQINSNTNEIGVPLTKAHNSIEFARPSSIP